MSDPDQPTRADPAEALEPTRSFDVTQVLGDPAAASGGWAGASSPPPGYSHPTGPPQAGYPQAGCPEAGYPQAEYGYGGYPQAEYGYGGYPRAGYGYGGYPQAGYGYGGYPQAGSRGTGSYPAVSDAGYPYPMPDPRKSKLAAAVLAFAIGTFGVHNFYLGYTAKATAQVLLSTVGALLTCGLSLIVTFIWSMVEGVMLLTGSIAVDGHGIPLKQ